MPIGTKPVAHFKLIANHHGHLDPPPITHRLWGIDEVVRLIVTDLKRGDNASAVALACCSRLLSDIVLDVLWQYLEDLCQLLMCLPPDTWEVHEDEFVSATCFTSSFLRSLMVDRFSYVVPQLRNGSDCRVTLAGYTSTTNWVTEWNAGFRWKRTNC